MPSSIAEALPLGKCGDDQAWVVAEHAPDPGIGQGEGGVRVVHRPNQHLQGAGGLHDARGFAEHGRQRQVDGEVAIARRPFDGGDRIDCDSGENAGVDAGVAVPDRLQGNAVERRHQDPLPGCICLDPFHDLAGDASGLVEVGLAHLVLDFDVHQRRVPDRGPGFVERGHPRRCSLDRLEVLGDKWVRIRYRSFLVMNDHRTVSGAPDVEFDTVCAMLDGDGERLDGVLPGVHRGSAVPVHERLR